MTRKAAGFPASLKTAETAAKGGLLRPQRPLLDAARDAARQTVPSGLGLDSQAVRGRMAERLRAGGIHHDAVLEAFAAVPRHAFVDTALVTQAYEDTALPIGWGQTISKPSVVARMLCLLFEARGPAGQLGAVLEIGTGCGYQTALLSRLSRRVVSIERLKPLHDKARTHLAPWRASNVRLVYGDGRRGHAPNAPYDSIIAAAGGEDLPAAWIDQLADGGRLIAPVHDEKSGGQVLLVLDKQGDATRQRLLDAVHFVPLKSGVA